jgi:hypothetical protein
MGRPEADVRMSKVLPLSKSGMRAPRGIRKPFSQIEEHSDVSGGRKMSKLLESLMLTMLESFVVPWLQQLSSRPK